MALSSRLDEVQERRRLQAEVAEHVFGWVRQDRFENQLDRAAFRRGKVIYRPTLERTLLIPPGHEHDEDLDAVHTVDGIVITGTLPAIGERGPEGITAMAALLDRMAVQGFRLELWYDDEQREYVARYADRGRFRPSSAHRNLGVALAGAAIAAQQQRR